MTFATSPAGAAHQTCFSKTMLRTSGPHTEPSLWESCETYGHIWRKSWKNHVAGWWFQPLWKILVSWDDYSQYMGKNTCSKPPTRWKSWPFLEVESSTWNWWSFQTWESGRCSRWKRPSSAPKMIRIWYVYIYIHTSRYRYRYRYSESSSEHIELSSLRICYSLLFWLGFKRCHSKSPWLYPTWSMWAKKATS